MKSLFQNATLGVMMFSGFGAVAQIEFPSPAKASMTDPLVFLQLQKKSNTEKTTSSDERVVAKVLYHYLGSVYEGYDSTAYQWGWGKSSVQEEGYVTIEDFSSSINSTFSSGAWYYDKKVMKTYNAIGKIAEIMTLVWDGSTWVETNKNVYSYTGTELTRHTYSGKDLSTGIWTDATQTLFTYAGGLQTEITTQIWDAATLTLKNNSQVTMTYTGTNLTQRVIKTWDGTWKNTNKEDYIYTAASMTQMEQSIWEETSSSWRPDYRDNYTYTGTDVTECISEQYDEISMTWGNSNRFIRTFASGKVKEIVFQNWTAGAWQNSLKQTNTYTSGNFVEMMNSSWNTSAAKWIDDYRYAYDYNANNSLMLTKAEAWDGSSWERIAPDTKYYYESYTGIKNDTPYVSKASIFPNPASGPNVYVDYFTEKSEPTEVILSNIMGQPLFSFSEKASIGDHSVIIPVAALPKGIYVVSIYCNGIFSKTIKLVK